MGFDEAGDDGASGDIELLGVCRHRDRIPCADRFDAAVSYDEYAIGDGRSACSIDNLRPDEGLEPGRDLDRFLCCTTTGCGHDEAEYHDESLSQHFLHSPKFCRDPTAT